MGIGKGSGKSDGTSVALIAVVVSVFAILQLTKFIVGIVYWNGCPANESIPKYMVGSASAETILDTIIGCIACLADEVDGIGVAIVEHLIGIIIGSVYIFSDYSYLAGGCDGAEECCNNNFIKFALGVSIIEWLLFTVPCIALIGYFILK